MFTFDGLYRGLIIQNNDPSNSGRVKVFVPGLNLTQIKNWNSNKEEDKFFKVVGGNTKSSITLDILQNQKEKLVWAEVMLPIMGVSSPGIYNAPLDTYYIGNDSDYLSQSSNKTPEFFENDAAIAEVRKYSPPPQNPSYGVPPRTDLNLTFPQKGPKFDINTGCQDSEPTSISSVISSQNSSLDEIINQLSPTYTSSSLNLDATPFSSNPYISSDDNIAVVEVTINVTNPTVLIKDVSIPEDSPVYNTNCFVVTNTSGKLSFAPPVLFESSTLPASNVYADLPVGIIINGKQTFSNNFKLVSSDNLQAVYVMDDIKVVVPKSNVNSISIAHNPNSFDINKIPAIAPLLQTSNSNVIMPRTPMPNGTSMASRGGGGGDIFSNIVSKLLPIFQRKDSHFGGANNESKNTISNCRKPSNDPNNTKGNNFRGNVGQVHRGPIRSANYNNNWKGVVSIPGIGSHVWVIFERGDPNYPVIIGTFLAQEDYKGIYKNTTVPPKTEEQTPKKTNTDSSEAVPDATSTPGDAYNTKASSFADPKDVEAFNRCKAAGGTDQQCFKVGDNGIGFFKGVNTADPNTPYAAVPREVWKEKWGTSANAAGKGIEVTYKNPQTGETRTVIGKLGDTMPSQANIKNGAGIDLNPGFSNKLGMKPPFLEPVSWKWTE